MSPEPNRQAASTSAARILVIEDEDSLRMALADALLAAGYRVLEAADGEAGLQMALREDPDLILLDLMLPKRDGFSVLKALREDRLTAPVLILSARGEEWDRVQGFEYGADDYLVKPFSMRELLLRIRAASQRAAGQAPGVSELPRSTRFGQVEVDFAAYSLLNAGVRHGLSRRELELLRYFLAHEGQALDRLTILDAVWGQDESPTTRTVDMHVLKLRKKLEPDPEQPVHLVTVFGVGYRFLRRP
jgi:two-component system alkaline phosphatase synthesis response regulator PhoP